MKSLNDEYFNFLVQQTNDKIGEVVNLNSISSLISEVFIRNYTEKKKLSFHEEYLAQTGKINEVIKVENFFDGFMQRYSLMRGIKKELRKQMEADKIEIINAIRKSPIKAYTQFFMSAKSSGDKKERNLASFFTKLAHTIDPKMYPVLDDYVREHFNFKREGFFYSYCVISEAYHKWIEANEVILNTLKKELLRTKAISCLKVPELTDLKILDMIFWSKGKILIESKRALAKKRKKAKEKMQLEKQSPLIK